MVYDGEGGIRTLERGYPRYAISSRARSTAPAPLQALDRRLRRHAPISDRCAIAEGYDTDASAVARLPSMLLAASPAVTKDIGLIVTFVGIGIIVNVIVVFIAVQVRGER